MVPGTYMFSATAKSEKGDGVDLVTGGTTLSYSPEFQNPSSNYGLLARLADIAKGRVLDEKKRVYEHNLQAGAEPQPLWPLLLLLAIILFLMDVFTRRVLIGWAEVKSGILAVRRWFSERYGWRRLGEEAKPTSRLLKVKESVRTEETQTTTAREDFLASLKKAQTTRPTGQPVTLLKKEEEKSVPKSKAPPPAAPRATPDEPGTYTSELLKARQKAKKKFDKDA